jgi:hypothetical protein
MADKEKKLEQIFWSIALPGFAQLLNGKYVKGILFIVLEFLINIQGNFNKVIILSFQGEISQAIEQADYQWLMFYPCLYMFAIWDAYRDAGGAKTPYSFLPFAFAAYFITVGVIFVRIQREAREAGRGLWGGAARREMRRRRRPCPARTAIAEILRRKRRFSCSMRRREDLSPIRTGWTGTGRASPASRSKDHKVWCFGRMTAGKRPTASRVSTIRYRNHAQRS